MYLRVGKAQVTKNRKGIAELWSRINPQWVDLNDYLCNDKDSRRHLLKVCDGKDGPNNPCGAVGCFAGWNWTYHPYQNWCRKHKIQIDSVSNLNIYLGVKHDSHGLWHSRHMDLDMSHMEEVRLRLVNLLKMDIYDEAQEAWKPLG
jgi:hypothetical protein